MKLQNLARKFQRVWREEGWKAAVGRVAHFAGNTEGRKERRIDSKKAKREKGTVLFINGYYAENPVRYRVFHQMEQLREAGISCNKVYFEDLELSMENNYHTFIFYRCEYMDIIGEFIRLAKQHQKKVIFDIDDLVFDTVYTDQVPFVKEMSSETKAVFDEVVGRVQKTLKLCDAATTTTEALAEELKKYVPEVVVNRNVVSKEMIACAEKAYKEKTPKDDGSVWLGYFSGSLTHNQDFEIIRPVLIRIMKQYPQVKLLLAGELQIPDEFKEFGSRVRTEGMIDWRSLPSLIAQVDINLAPLEDTIFNRAKSELKWFEAALVRVPTVASRVGAFERMIEEGTTGHLARNMEEEWYRILRSYIEDAKLRTNLAQNAYSFVMRTCTVRTVPNSYLELVKG